MTDEQRQWYEKGYQAAMKNVAEMLQKHINEDYRDIKEQLEKRQESQLPPAKAGGLQFQEKER